MNLKYHICRIPWLDVIAGTSIVGLKLFIFTSYGIADWTQTDGVGYVQVADQLLRPETWVSVPDLGSALIPISLLRLPGYPVLILAARGLAGAYWLQAIIGFQFCLSAGASFLLYRALWAASGLWAFAVAGVIFWCLTWGGLYDGYLLTESLTFSLFAAAVSALAMAALGRGLTRRQIFGLAVAFSCLFLLREVNFLFSLTLVPLVGLALPPSFRDLLRGTATIFIPVILCVILMAGWQSYRVGHFLLTAGGLGNPIVAVIIADKLTPFLDDTRLVDQVVRDATASMTAAEVRADPMTALFHVNEELSTKTGANAAGRSRMLQDEYVSAWLRAPKAMLAYAWTNSALVRISDVSTVIYDDQMIPIWARQYYSYKCQQISVMGLILIPLILPFWLFVLPFRRRVLVALSLWFFAAVIIAFYASMWFAVRFVQPALPALLLVVSIPIGAVVDLGRAAIAGRLQITAKQAAIAAGATAASAAAWIALRQVPGWDIWFHLTDLFVALALVFASHLGFLVVRKIIRREAELPAL